MDNRWKENFKELLTYGNRGNNVIYPEFTGRETKILERIFKGDLTVKRY